MGHDYRIELVDGWSEVTADSIDEAREIADDWYGDKVIDVARIRSDWQ